MTTVVFDLGDVLVPSGGVLPRLAEHLGVTGDRLALAYWPPREEYDLGCSESEYWSAVLRLLGRDPEPDVVAAVAALDAAKWSTLPDAGQAVLDGLAGTVPLGILSNAPLPLAASVRAAPWSRVMGGMVFSAELGLVKPDPRIYARADELLGTAPGDVVFLDDRADNVAAARAHGWDAHVWREGTTAADVLALAGPDRQRTGR